MLSRKFLESYGSNRRNVKSSFSHFVNNSNKLKSSCHVGILHLILASALLGLGTAEDRLTYHKDRKFSTKDKNNDISSSHCAVDLKGAWWYGDCRKSNLNGFYRNGADNGTVLWGLIRPVKRSEMKIRPMDFYNQQFR